MRTKTLLGAVAALAAGVAASMAQTYSYSPDVVGYVNLTLSPTGYSAVGVQMDSDGTGVNNVLTNFVNEAGLPYGTFILTWNPAKGGYDAANTFGPTSKNTTPHWTTPGVIYNCGEGLFVNNPSNYAVNMTIFGTVLQGVITNHYTGAGYSFFGVPFPKSGGITTTFGVRPDNGDYILTWTGSGFGAANTFGPTSKNTIPHWTTGEPQLAVGQAFFFWTTNPAPLIFTNIVPLPTNAVP
jgi:hypothetical protein